jgi:hypothetical protein
LVLVDSEALHPTGLTAAEFASVRERISALFQSVGGAPDWLVSIIRNGFASVQSGADLGAAIVAGCDARGVEVPDLDGPEVCAVLDLLLPESSSGRLPWISDVWGGVADALADANSADDDGGEA